MKQKTEPGTKRAVKHGTTSGDGFEPEIQSPAKVEQNQTLNQE
jgi:hypothetical protein